MRSQIEVASPPQLELTSCRGAARLRTALADAAERAGARLVAVGARPAAGPHARIVDKPRYHRMRERFGDLSPGAGINGMHVHVSVPDPETGVQVLNHLRPWLPIFQAATANSPLFDGRDTGYASWRSMLWDAGPPSARRRTWSPTSSTRRWSPTWSPAARCSTRECSTGTPGCPQLPTVEIRMGDVCPTLDDAMLLAALARALVATILQDVRAGRPAPDVPHPLLMAAHWRAAHDGLEGLTSTWRPGRPRPAWRLMRQLFDYVRPELDRHGDLETATVLMGRLRSHGTGAARQRAVLAQRGAWRTWSTGSPRRPAAR